MPTPDPSLFSVDRRSGEYRAEFSVRGTISVPIKADSIKDAKRKAADLCDDEEFGLELDDTTGVEVDCVRPVGPLYRVWDGGRKCQVSRLREGHTPRDPDERGF